MTLDIVCYGAPVLREKAQQVPTITPELQQLADDMLETVTHHKAVGLAANQVGKAVQLCVIDYGVKRVLFNPVITTFGKPAAAYESCLSFPGVCTRVRRPDGVKVSYLDREGQPQTLEATGTLARIIQHEVDHLNGILIRDHNNKFKRV